MPAHRQSALLLHGLSKPDQRWVLSQLAQDDRAILACHLAELRELGIPAEPALADQASGVRALAAAGPLHAATPAMMQLVLADEPLWMVRHVLAMADWPWRSAFLAAYNESQRERLGAHSVAPLQGEAGARLMAHLASRLALHAGLRLAPVHAARPGPLAMLRHAMRRWA